MWNACGIAVGCPQLIERWGASSVTTCGISNGNWRLGDDVSPGTFRRGRWVACHASTRGDTAAVTGERVVQTIGARGNAVASGIDVREPAARLKLFISYSHYDLGIADTLVGALEGAGFEVKIDRRNLPYGEEWQGELTIADGSSANTL